MTRSRWAWTVALICNLGLLVVWLWSRPAGLPLPGSKWIAWPAWLTQLPSWFQSFALPDQGSALPYTLALGVIGISCVAGATRTARWRRNRVLPALESATAWAESLALTRDEEQPAIEEASPAPWSSGVLRLIAGEHRPMTEVIEPFTSRGLPVLVVGSGAVRRSVLDTGGESTVEYMPGGTPTDTILLWCATHPEGLVAVAEATALDSGSAIDVAGNGLLAFGEEYRIRTVEMASVIIVEPVPVERLVLDESWRARCSAMGLEFWAVLNGVCRPVKASEPQTVPELLLAKSHERALSESAQRWATRLAFLAATAVFVAISVVLMAPAFFSGPHSTVLIGDTARGLSGSLWGNWWVYQSLQSGDLFGAFWSDSVFWPDGASLIAIFGSVFSMLLSVPFQWLGEYPGYWNFFVLCALASSGLAARALALGVGLSREAALIVGTVFAFSPVMLGEVSAGHQIQFWAFSLPLAILFGWRSIEDATPRVGWWAGIFLGITCLASWQYGMFAVVAIFPVWLRKGWGPGRVLSIVERDRQFGRVFRAFAPALLMAIPLLIEANQGTLTDLQYGVSPLSETGTPGGDRRVTTLVNHSIGLSALLVGTGDWITRLPHVLGLVLLATWGASRWRRYRLWIGLAALSALLGAGPFLQPGLLSEGWLSLPYAWLYRWLPFFSPLLYPERWWILGSLFVGLMLGRMWDDWRWRLPKWLRWPVTVAAVIGIGLGVPSTNHQLPLKSSPFEMPSFYANLGVEGAVIEVPIGYRERSIIYQPIHKHATLNGPGEARRVDQEGAFRAMIEEDPVLFFLFDWTRPLFAPNGLEAMRERGLRYVVVNTLLINQLAQTRGDPRTVSLLTLASRIDQVLGPPLFRDVRVRVYQLPETYKDLESLQTVALQSLDKTMDEPQMQGAP